MSSDESGDEIDLEELVQKLFQSRSNANLLCDILKYLQSDDFDEEELTIGFVGCEKWFTERISEGVFERKSSDASSVAFREWVSGQLGSFLSILCHKSTDPELSDLAFQLLIRFYLIELEMKTKAIQKSKITRAISAHLCDFENDKTEEIEKFCEFLAHPSLLLEISNGIRDLLDKSSDRNEVLAQNITFYFECITQLFPNDEMDQSHVTPKAIKNALQRLLTTFLRHPLTDHFTKKILNMFPQLYPCLENPLFLADYVTHCYNSSNSSISLLALHAIFRLMTEHNFEYPDFFDKLYRLLTDEVVYSNHRVRFFHLLDLFLASPLLPLKMQAAFTKRLSRQCLHAPAPVILALLPLIFNQIRRSQALFHLINAPKPITMQNDPYDHKTDKMDECNALESSLWEIETLRKHFVPEVKRMANCKPLLTITVTFTVYC